MAKETPFPARTFIPITQHNKLRVLASYHVHKPLSALSLEDLQATTDMVKGRCTVMIEERFAPKTLTLDEVIEKCLAEWATCFKSLGDISEQAAEKRGKVNNPNVSEDDRKDEARLLGVPYVETPKPTVKTKPSKMQAPADTGDEL